MTRLIDALDMLPLPGECECACREYCRQMRRCDRDCLCYPCPICHPDYFEGDEDWEPAEFTSATCRPVTLPSGETLPVLGAGPLSPQGVAALSELVDAVRAKAAAENPPDEGAPELWARVEAARGEKSLRECARLAGVRFAVLFRIGQGRMPGPEDLAAIERWLTDGGL